MTPSIDNTHTHIQPVCVHRIHGDATPPKWLIFFVQRLSQIFIFQQFPEVAQTCFVYDIIQNRIIVILD